MIITSNNKEFLYSLRDLSNIKHTSENLAKEIDQVLSLVGPKKFSAIVTDNAAAIANVQKQISEKYPHILNIRCIAHYINLITKDVLGMYMINFSNIYYLTN